MKRIFVYMMPVINANSICNFCNYPRKIVFDFRILLRFKNKAQTIKTTWRFLKNCFFLFYEDNVIKIATKLKLEFWAKFSSSENQTAGKSLSSKISQANRNALKVKNVKKWELQFGLFEQAFLIFFLNKL